MAYKGETYAIPCDQVGFSANPNIDKIPPESMVHPSRNVNLHNGGIGKRGGTAKVNSTVITDAPDITGEFDFILRNGTQFTVFTTSDGKIYKNSTTTIKTGLATDKISSFAVMNNKLYIFNGANVPQVWDGSAAATSDLANIPSDWTGSNFPSQAIVHGYGNSERMWAINCPTNPHWIYASAINDGLANADFSDANVLALYIETGDGFGIVGGVEFGDRLFCFGKSKSFYVDDTDLDPTNWGYIASSWKGGAASFRLIIETPNDLVAMMEDGEIYSCTAVESYGDYKQASLTRPAHMHEWIKDNVALAQISQFHAIYDPELRAIKFFIVRSGQTTVDTAMVYFLDRPAEKSWSIHDNQSYASGYSARCSALVRVSIGVYKVYTGDYSGFIWKLEQSNKADDSNGYYAGFKLPHLTFGNPRVHKRYDNGRVIVEPEGAWNLSINTWIDGELIGSTTVSLGGSGGLLDSFTLGTSALGGQELIDNDFSIGAVGKRIQQEFYNSTALQDFFVSQILYDFVQLGGKP